MKKISGVPAFTPKAHIDGALAPSTYSPSLLRRLLEIWIAGGEPSAALTTDSMFSKYLNGVQLVPLDYMQATRKKVLAKADTEALDAWLADESLPNKLYERDVIIWSKWREQTAAERRRYRSQLENRKNFGPKPEKEILSPIEDIPGVSVAGVTSGRWSATPVGEATLLPAPTEMVESLLKSILGQHYVPGPSSEIDVRSLVIPVGLLRSRVVAAVANMLGTDRRPGAIIATWAADTTEK